MLNKKAKQQINLLVVGAAALLILFLMKGGGTGDTQALADTSSAVITRSLPSTVSPGETFTVTYSSSGTGSGSFGVSFEDFVSGGCSPTVLRNGFLSPRTSSTITYTAPQIGTCIFSGNYQFTGSTQKSMQGNNRVNLCQSQASSACSSGDVYWFDSCGNRGNIKEDCASFQTCQNAACVTNCDTLKTDGVNALIFWINNPTVVNRNAATSTITTWATNC